MFHWWRMREYEMGKSPLAHYRFEIEKKIRNDYLQRFSEDPGELRFGKVKEMERNNFVVDAYPIYPIPDRIPYYISARVILSKAKTFVHVEGGAMLTTKKVI